MKSKIIEKLPFIGYVLLILTIIIIGIYSTYYTITLGSKSSDYDIICINSQQFYRANFWAKGFLANRLDNDGKPINCKENQ